MAIAVVYVTANNSQRLKRGVLSKCIHTDPQKYPVTPPSNPQALDVAVFARRAPMLYISINVAESGIIPVERCLVGDKDLFSASSSGCLCMGVFAFMLSMLRLRARSLPPQLQEPDLRI